MSISQDVSYQRTHPPGFRIYSKLLLFACGDIPRLVALVLGARRSLVMAKDIKGFYPIPIGETFFQLISHSICLTILKAISKYVKSFPRFGHFPASIWSFDHWRLWDHHFCIKTLFNLHLDWVEMQVNIKNAFNNVFQTIIFKELQDAKGPLASILLPSCFMVFILIFITSMGNMRKESPLFNHF